MSAFEWSLYPLLPPTGPIKDLLDLEEFLIKMEGVEECESVASVRGLSVANCDVGFLGTA